ncbi:MAG: heme ABC exporter ATP-binding protein CcmA [Legionellales bacterium]
MWQNSPFGTLAENMTLVQEITFNAAHLGCSRDEQLLFKPLSFALKSGEALIIEGPNGIGKTTLLRVLTGLLQPLCGQISCNVPIKENVAYLGPHNAVKGLLTPKEYLNYFSTFDEAVLAQLQLTGLENKTCASLSSGQKQRVALARIVLSKKPIWILDEPMTALDKQGEQIFAQLLQTHLEQKGIAIIATHHVLTENHFKKIILEP